jgi:AcrR family transcriptional regulator
MDERERRIVEAAVELAEQGGFEGVRQRDVAAQSGVALGTLYKRFKGKDELLVAALNLEHDKLDERLRESPIVDPTLLGRLEQYFEASTQVFVQRPNLGRATIRAVASGEPDIAQRIHAYHIRMGEGIRAVVLGPSPETTKTETGLDESQLANLGYLLQQIWFSGLVGWSAGLVDPREVVSRVIDAADLLLRGFEARRAEKSC